MYCPNCGIPVSNQAKYCGACGSDLGNTAGILQPIAAGKQQLSPPGASESAATVAPQMTAVSTPEPAPPGEPQPRPHPASTGEPQFSTRGAPQPATTGTQQPVPLLGFSPRINDPAFARYIKHSYLWPLIFAIILAIIAAIGFYIAGERGIDGMGNPESLYYGFGVGGMFITIALFQILGRKRGKTWDGTVRDKQINKRTRRRKSEDGSSYYWDYLEYLVVIISNGGKKHELRDENDDTRYNYYQIGDRVRHHGGLRSFEKYDKTGDQIIFCNACATLCDINDDYCFRCKCPLLK